MENSKKLQNRKHRSERIRAAFPIKAGCQSGFTRDISATGFFIELPEFFEIGSHVPIEVELNLDGRLLKLKALGEVVRRAKLKGSVGLGIRLVNQEIYTEST